VLAAPRKVQFRAGDKATAMSSTYSGRFPAPLSASVTLRARNPYQRSAAVCTGASHKASSSASSTVTVNDAPAISSEVV